MTELAKEGEKASAHLLEEKTLAPQAAFHQFSSSKGSAYAPLISLPFSESHHIF